MKFGPTHSAAARRFLPLLLLIAIGALIAIVASAVTALAVRAGAGGTPAQAAVGAGTVAGPRDTVTVVGEGTQFCYVRAVRR